MGFNKDQDYWVSVFHTNDFLSIETNSGLGRVRRDPVFLPHLLSPEADDKSVGEVILKSLSDSRTLNSLEERVAFFDRERSKEQHTAWIKMLMEQYGYKTKNALFKSMKHCIIHCVNNVITISPTWHEKLEAWSGDRISESDYVVLPADSSPAEIGAGLRLALTRCKG